MDATFAYVVGIVVLGIAIGFLVHSIPYVFIVIGGGFALYGTVTGMLDYLAKWR